MPPLNNNASATPPAAIETTAAATHESPFSGRDNAGRLFYDGQEIPCDEQGWPELTAIWRAAKAPRNRRPVDWRKRKETQKVEKSVSEKIRIPSLFRVVPGRNGCTFAHPLLASAYAAYLNAPVNTFTFTGAFVYMVETLPGKVKIGITGDIVNRLNSLRHNSLCYAGIDCHVLQVAQFESLAKAKQCERGLHHENRLSWLIGEWFNLSPAQIGDCCISTQSSAGFQHWLAENDSRLRNKKALEASGRPEIPLAIETEKGA